MAGFNCFIGVDWSGAGGKWQKGLQVAVALPGRSAPQLISPPGFARWSRTSFDIWITRQFAQQRVLAGFDFAFGFPAPHSPRGGAVSDWEYVDDLCGEDPNYYGGKFFRCADTPHSRFVNSPWLPRRDYAASLLRETDRAAARLRGATPQSIFNAIGPAQVGPSSISGMRFLFHLRRRKLNIAVWPFEKADEASSVVVEIFPRYFALSRALSPRVSDHVTLNRVLAAYGSEPVAEAPNSEDEGDALLSAAALRFLVEDKSVFQVPEGIPACEGWIFGVPPVTPQRISATAAA